MVQELAGQKKNFFLWSGNNIQLKFFSKIELFLNQYYYSCDSRLPKKVLGVLENRRLSIIKY